MQHADYVALHVHSEFSLLDGAIKVDELVRTAAEYKMPAVAVTDHGNLFGAIEFYKKAQKAGVKPIIGCEVYVAPQDRFDKSRGELDEAAFHLILLARNNDGYKNLVSLVTRAYLEGFYYRPRIDKELLEQYSGGLIGLSACLQGEVPYFLRHGSLDRAREAALSYKRILGAENFYLELQANGLPEQEKVNRQLIELGAELHIGLVATNDCHYLKREDAKAHEVLLCIQTGKTMSDQNRMRFEGTEFYFRSPEEMKEHFKEVPEAIKNTRQIAERCNVEFKLGAEPVLPRYQTPDGSRPRDYMQKLALQGLKRRMGDNLSTEYMERFDREIGMIKKMGYASYFLIVWDFISYAKKHHIPVGPGRGSAAGSLVAYALGITEIDPMKYGLLFERFLNPERVSMPDIDVDFCKDKRPLVIEYVAKKYGRDHVAQIITFGTMAARAVIRDVARALDFPYAEADKLAKLVPETLKITIDEALRQEPEMKKLYDRDEAVKELINIARRLEGLARHASTHAAGIVIAPAPLTDYMPLYKHPSDEALTTQFEMGSVENVGLVKFDFLGLKTLTIIDKAVKYINEGGTEFSIEEIALDDEQTYRFLSSGKTTGVFQLESDGMKDILVKMEPSRFEDIIALVALYRPGPIKSGMIDDFIKRKKGLKAVTYMLPELKDILDETYGVIIYQEQVMSIANKVANFTMGQADVLRKAMGKKIADVMEKQKEVFISGALKNNIPRSKAEELFDLMAFFAEYGFNKSHSAAYAFITYQTAYLKAHYPVHFMAATLSSDLGNSDKIVKSIKECRDMGIAILPPNINRCGREFTVDGSSIRFGLAAVKGAGAQAIDSIIESRGEKPFSSIEDYLRRIDTRRVNKKVNESLVKSGAMDSLGALDGSMQSICSYRAEGLGIIGAASGGAVPSLNLFGPAEGEEEADEDSGEAGLLRDEKETLGFYISGNPLDKYRKIMDVYGIRGVSALAECADRQDVEAAGIVSGIKKLRTRRKNEQMAALTIDDGEGEIEVVVFPDLYAEAIGVIEKETPVIIKGTVEVSESGVKMVATGLRALEELCNGKSNGKKAIIHMGTGRTHLKELKQVLQGNAGAMPVYLSIRHAGAETFIQTSLSIDPDGKLIDQIEEMLGKGAIKVL